MRRMGSDCFEYNPARVLIGGFGGRAFPGAISLWVVDLGQIVRDFVLAMEIVDHQRPVRSRSPAPLRKGRSGRSGRLQS
jgi:hypothetical protein